LDREEVSRAKILSNTVKQKRKEKAGKWTVPIPKVKPIADDEMFKQMKSGKRQKNNWKRMITKVLHFTVKCDRLVNYDFILGHVCGRELHKKGAKI
jgi:hypothetical protein